MKKLVLCSSLVLVMGLGVCGVTMAEDKGPAEIILQTAAAKKPATFPHAKHQGFMKCDDCHKDPNFPADKAWDMKKGHAFCQDCHKNKEVNGKKGPVKCTECHKK